MVVGGQLAGRDTLLALSAILYVVAPLGSGMLVMAAASRHLDRRGRWAWTLLGAGVAAWGVGEITWQYYSFFLRVEVPYPGVADVFYMSGYLAMFAGVVLLPHLQPRKWERIRFSLDTVAGSIAICAIAWTAFLNDAVHLDPDAGVLENAINLGYTIGDLILLVALMILATRRSAFQFDGRLVALGAAIALTATADIVYLFQVEAGTYVDGSRLDGLWLASYGLFALTAFLVFEPVRYREQADRPVGMWPIIAPYSAIAALFVLAVMQLGGPTSRFDETTTGVVGLLIIVRQAIAIRENRAIVEKQRNDLVASLSHELRTPLTAMSGFTEILDEFPMLDTNERMELISIVASQTKHLSRIVGDLVQVSRDQLQSLDLAYRTIDMAELVGSAIEMLTIDSSNTSITAHIQPGLNIAADRDRIRQVLVNYLTNADRYGQGIVEVHARADADGVLVEVHDNGPGVPKKHEVAIWDRFERGAHTYMSKVQGSGLGLAIARQLVTAHHGHTGYRPSNQLGGACFWLTLPRRQLAPKALAVSTKHPTPDPEPSSDLLETQGIA